MHNIHTVTLDFGRVKPRVDSVDYETLKTIQDMKLKMRGKLPPKSTIKISDIPF